MKDKKRIIICTAVAVVIVAGIIVGFFIGKRNADKNTDIDNSTTSTTTTTPEYSHKVPAAIGDVKFEGGVARGICTYKGVDYVATEDGLFAVTASGKKKLTSQSVDNYLSIIDDKIYYSAESQMVKEYVEGFEEYIDWQLYEGWVMNLDGSGQKKLVDFIGDGFIICADDNTIYYAESPGPNIYTCGIGYYIYKYDIKTGEKIAIDRGKSPSSSEDEIWYDSIDDICYADGKIYYRNYTCDGSYTRAAVYDIKTSKVTEITDNCSQLYLAKNGTLYMNCGEEQQSEDGSRSYESAFLASYSADTDKITKIKDLDKTYDVLYFDSDEVNLYYSHTNYIDNNDSYIYTFSIYSYNSVDGEKEIIKSHSGMLHSFSYDSKLDKLTFIVDEYDSKTESSSILVKQIEGGKEKTIANCNDFNGYLSSCGRYVAVADIYNSDADLPDNDYYEDRIVFYNK